jgi:hypothetical protein
MLVDEQAEKKLEKMVKDLLLALTVYLLGRGTDPDTHSLSSNALLVQAFMTGRLTQLSGTIEAENFSAEEVTRWSRNNYHALTNADRAELETLSGDTLRLVKNHEGTLMRDLRERISISNREWATYQLLTKNTPSEEMKRLALEKLDGEVEAAMVAERNRLVKLIQTELGAYFNRGQVSGIDPEEGVYKIPRPNACHRCMEIHLNADGSPKIYKLTQRPPEGPNQYLAESRKLVLEGLEKSFFSPPSPEEPELPSSIDELENEAELAAQAALGISELELQKSLGLTEEAIWSDEQEPEVAVIIIEDEEEQEENEAPRPTKAKVPSPTVNLPTEEEVE